MNNKTRQVAHALSRRPWKNYPYEVGDKVIAVKTSVSGRYTVGEIGKILAVKNIDGLVKVLFRTVGQWLCYPSNLRPYNE